MEHVCLEKYCFPITQILPGRFHGLTEIDAHHMRAPACSYFGKASHAAAHVEH